MKHTKLLSILLFLFLFSINESNQSLASDAYLVDKVVAIKIVGLVGENRGTGTPVYYDQVNNETYILTCNHIYPLVIKNIQIANVNSIYDASVVARHPIVDLSLIKIEGQLPVVQVKKSDQPLTIGSTVRAFGYAHGKAPPLQYIGHISSYNDVDQTFFFTTKVAQGVSGGPVTENGEICGVVTACSAIRGHQSSYAIGLKHVHFLLNNHLPKKQEIDFQTRPSEVIDGPEPSKSPPLSTDEVVTDEVVTDEVVTDEVVTDQEPSKSTPSLTSDTEKGFSMTDLLWGALLVGGTLVTGGTAGYIYKGYRVVKTARNIHRKLRGEDTVSSDFEPEPTRVSPEPVYQPQPQPVPIQTPAEAEYQTRYIKPATLVTQVDHFSEAVDWAQRQMLLLHPGSIDTINHFNSLVQQYLEGKKLK